MDNIKDSKTRLYETWRNMRSRCNKTYANKYKYYGGKGIKVCPEWDNDFKSFKEWALKNGYTDEMTIDRIDSNKDYSPDNCQWLTMEEHQEKSLKDRRLNLQKNCFAKEGGSNMSKIKEARISANLTQDAMEEKLGIPKRTIQDWEAGRRNPPEYVERLVIAELERIKNK